MAQRRYFKGPVREMTRDERIYLAGLLDGEGCFMLTSSGEGKLNVNVRVAMCHKPTIEWVSNAVGRPIRQHGLGVKAAMRARTMWRVEVANLQGVASLITQVMPFLLAKREVASAILQYCQSRLSARYFSGAGERGYTNEDRALYARVRKLNQIGVTPVTH